MDDYIQLPRSALSDELWRNKDYGCLLWFLLSRANEQGVTTFTATDIELRLGVSRQRLRTMLAKMKKSGLATNIQPTSNQQATNKQPTKARKTASKFIPPTEEEVAQYVAEKGYHFNPEQFIPYYEKQEWKQNNGLPIKDWKAACRYWETRWKEKHGEQFYYQLALPAPRDTPASRKERRDRGLSLANQIVSGSENLLSLYNGSGEDPNTGKN